MLRALSMLPNGTQQTDQPVDSPKAVIILAIQGGPEDEPFFDPPFPRPEKMREMNSQVVADQRNQNLARHKLPFDAHHRAHPPPHQHPNSNRDHIACGVDPSTKPVGTLAPRFLGAERLELGGQIREDRVQPLRIVHFVGDKNHEHDRADRHVADLSLLVSQLRTEYGRVRKLGVDVPPLTPECVTSMSQLDLEVAINELREQVTELSERTLVPPQLAGVGRS